jgi:TolB protein
LYSCKGDKGKILEIEPEYAIIYNVLIDNESDNYDVFSMNIDGSEKKNISNIPGVEWSYISDKDKVLFVSDKDSCNRCFGLYEANYLGNHLSKITDIALADSWMSIAPNGDLIITPSRKIDSAFYIINRKGDLLDRIETGLPYSSDPLFVNEGQQIVFRGGQTKSKLIEGFNEELYIIDKDGRNRRQLTHYPISDTTASKFAYKAGTPKLHPKEKYISYQSMQDGKYSLYALSTDGAQQWKLTDNPQNEGWHDWSPDGNWLAIELFDDDQTQFHIGLMNWQTKEMTILTDTSYQYQQCPNFVLKTAL